MLRDFRYIIKRIIIGVGIALVLAFLRGNLITTVSAKQISSQSFGGVTYDYDSSASQYRWDLTPGSWAGWGIGTLRGSVSTEKLTGSATSSFSPIRSIVARSGGNQEFQCTFGSVFTSNSTHERQVITYECHMQMYGDGLTSLSFVFLTLNQSDFTARLTINGTLTFESEGDNSDIVSTTDRNTQAVRDIGNQITSATNNNTNAINQTNNNIMNDDVSDSEDKASDFFDDFQSDAHGLSGVITAPLNFLQALTASTCSSLQFQLPIIHDQVNLPCMKPIYQQRFGVFFSLWQLITTGLISYNVCLNFYKKIRDLQDPNNDRIEVLNL